MPILNDANFGLMLSELVNRPTINASPEPEALKALWSSLTFYQWTPAVQGGIDQTLRLLLARRDTCHHAAAIAQTRDAMMADPDFYPFCLSPRYWPDAQRAHFRGLVGDTTYKPPAYWSTLAMDVVRTLGPVLVGTLVAAALPEEMVGGAVALAAMRLAGKSIGGTATKVVARMVIGSGMAGIGNALASGFAGPPTSGAAHDAEMWRRYKPEAKRRATL